MKECKPASFWICLGVVLALTVLLTTWTSLRLYPGLVNAPVPVGQERVYTLLVQQRVNLGEVCIYLAAVLLDIACVGDWIAGSLFDPGGVWLHTAHANRPAGRYALDGSGGNKKAAGLAQYPVGRTFKCSMVGTGLFPF